MYLSKYDFGECRRVAELIADGLSTCGTNSRTHVIGQEATCSGFNVSLQGGNATSPSQVRGGHSTLPSILVSGIRPQHVGPTPHPQCALICKPEVKAELIETLVGVLAYELALCLIRTAPAFDPQAWSLVARTAISGGKTVEAAYAEGVRQPYNSHATATRAVAEVVHNVLESGISGAVDELKMDTLKFKEKFRATKIARFVTKSGGQHGEALVGELWLRATAILHRMA